MGRERRQREHRLPRFPFHCYTNPEFNSGEPGASPELCDYLAERKIAMIGSDTWGLEVMDPSKPPPEAFGYCHMNLIVIVQVI